MLKSEGLVRVHQPQLLGVYRLVDSYNDRPVYKQDMGENYIYYRSGDCQGIRLCANLCYLLLYLFILII